MLSLMAVNVSMNHGYLVSTSSRLSASVHSLWSCKGLRRSWQAVLMCCTQAGVNCHLYSQFG